PNHIHIEDIFVPNELRGKGVGALIIRKVIELADQLHVLVSLQPAWTDEEVEPEFSIYNWYEHFGFHDGFDHEGYEREMKDSPWQSGDVVDGELIHDAR